MNNIQAFCKDEKNILRLRRAIREDECTSDCPAHSFCIRDGKRKQPLYDDCGEAFIAWALAENKSNGKG